MDATLDISVVVPLYNEEESLPELVEWIDRVARGEGLSYEVILVDDGSGDGSWRVIENLHERFAAVRGIKFARNYGKSAALYCGFAEARGEVVFTMDADLQDSPDEIPALRRMVLDEGYDLVSGWKKKRHDPAGKRWPSKFFNWTARTGRSWHCLYNLAPITHAVVQPPKRNINVPRLPKKYIGERPKRERNETVMRSRYPFTIRSIPNFE